MKTSFLALLTALVMIAAGCAHSDDSHQHHASHHRHHHSDGTSTTESASATPGSADGNTPPQAGAANAALGKSARDTLGHPAIDDY